MMASAVSKKEASPLPGPIDEVIAKYRSLRILQCQHKQSVASPGAPRVRYFARKEDAKTHPWEEQVRDGPGTTLLRSSLATSIGALGSSAAALRERLLLEAASRGYSYLVRELLCPPQESGSPPPVSLHVTDVAGNNILHLAVVSGNARLVRWILKHLKAQDRNLDSDLLGSLNERLEIPLSLAIRRGNIRLMHAILTVNSAMLIEWVLEAKRLGVGDQVSELARGERTHQSLIIDVAKVREGQLDETEKNLASEVLRNLAVLDAREHAVIPVRDVFDVWMRQQLYELLFKMLISKGGVSLATVKGYFEGHLHLRPWWDAQLSSFDLTTYIASRSEKENGEFFRMLTTAISSGSVDTAHWLLDHFKAPPSLASYQRTNFDPDWYLREAAKVMEDIVTGWTDERARDFFKEDSLSYNGSSTMICETTGSRAATEYNKNANYAEYRLRRIQSEYSFRDQQAASEEQSSDIDVAMFWRDIPLPKNTTSTILGDDHWFGVIPNVFLAVKRSCALPFEAFEESAHGELLAYFLSTVYSEDPNLLSADLPSLARFVALDHLPLFQFLVKERRSDGGRKRFLDLNIPLLCPFTSASTRDHENGDTVMRDEDDNACCCICLEPMSDPYKLTCGHNFHHECLFQYIFPALREGVRDSSSSTSVDDRYRLMYRVLSGSPHLSYTLGKTTCPYCRQAVKPCLNEAFALNLADGLKRTARERRNRPNSPHLDVSQSEPGITVGEALFAFAACSGAINILQWLARDCSVKPDHVKVGGVTVMHHAVSHRQALIIRWLCENGYSNMFYGGLDRSAFDSWIPSSEPHLELDDDNLERMSFWEKEIDLKFLPQYEMASEYSDSEKLFLQECPSGAEMQILALRNEAKKLSPLHFLIMDTFEGYDDVTIADDSLVQYLKSKQISLVPANWLRLVFSLSVSAPMRSSAKAFLSQAVLSIPQDLDNDTVVKSGLAVRSDDGISFYDVLSSPALEPLSLQTILNYLGAFNFWTMLMCGKDWRIFLQVASTLNVWNIWPSCKLFESKPDIYENMIAFVDAVIQIGRVDLCAAFSTMKSFQCRYSSGKFDLFSMNENKDRFLGLAKPLRPMVKRWNKWDLFSAFFDHVDLVVKVKRESYCAETDTVKAIFSGQSLAKIKSGIDIRKSRALSLPEVDEPFGMGTHENDIKHVDPSSWHWLDGCFRPLENSCKSIKHFKAVVQRRDCEILHWVFSLVLNGNENDSADGSEEVNLIRRVSEAIVEARELFALQEFLLFFTKEKGPSKYRNKRGELLVDLISYDKEDDVNFGGIVGSIFTGIIYSEADLHYEKDPDAGLAKDEVEKLYGMARWILQQTELSAFLAMEQNRAMLLSRIVSNISLKFSAANQPHQIFRLMNLLLSYGFDLIVDIGGKNLILHLFEWVSDTREKKHDLELLDTLRDGEEYKDSKGNPVHTIRDVLRWLVLIVGIDIQHLRYNDLLGSRGYSFRAPPISEDEWECLKEEQLALSTATT